MDYGRPRRVWPALRKPHYVLLAVALIVGGYLRLSGINWGLPDTVHTSYSYHPDEAFLIGWASALYRGEIVPKQFIYGGTFYFSTLEAGSRLARALAQSDVALLRDQIAVARYLSVAYALLSILFTYGAGAQLYSRQVGAFAALILALAPGHVLAAQIARPDALFTLLLTINLWFAARLTRASRIPNWQVFAGGAMLGLAVATRFPATVWWFGYLTALIVAMHARGLTARTVVVSLCALSAVALLAYLLASPHSVIYFRALLDGLRTQFAYQSGSFVEPLEHGPSWWQYGGQIMAQALGYGVFAPALAAIAYAAHRRERADYVIAAFALPYFLLLACTAWIVVRYFVPLLPLLALLIARLASAGLAARRPLIRYLTGAVAVAVMAVSALGIGIYTAALRQPDIRDQALQWLLANVPPGTSIGVLQGYAGDVFYHPPASARFRWSACPLTSCDLTTFLTQPLQVLIIADTYLHTPLRVADGRQLSVLDALAAQSTYVPVKRFTPPLSRFGYDVHAQFRAYDVRGQLPAITLYRR